MRKAQAPLETMGQSVRRKRFLTGQAIIEYALFAGVVIAALIAMQGYMKRGIQAVVKASADDIGDEKAGGMDSDPLFKRQIMSPVTESTSSTTGTNTFQRAVGGEVTYGTDTTTTTTAKDGILSSVLSWEREN